MSRLIQYINESNGEFIPLSPKNQGKIIKKDCKYYLNLTKNTGPFNRAVNKIMEPIDGLIKNKTRNDRRSLGMQQEAFKEFNDWLQKNGHIRRDKSVSVSSAGSSLQIFGKVYYFFPIGKFNYTWVKAHDINGIDTKTGWNGLEVQMFFDYTDALDILSDKEVKELRKKFPTYFTTNKGIEIAHKNKWEIWFDCKSYYLVNRKNKI